MTSSRRATAAALCGICVPALVAGCGAGEAARPSMIGVWASDDGTGLKTIRADGSCSGMYYNAGEPLDIGGPMTCSMGAVSASGSATMVVEQPPNQLSYQVRFTDADTMVLSNSAGTVVTLTRR